MDYAAGPQHPQGDLIGVLAGGRKLDFSEGRTPPCALRTVHASRTY